MRRFAALVAVLSLAGTAAAVPMGTGSLYVEVQGSQEAAAACSTSTFADQTYNVFGVDVNLGTTIGALQCSNSDPNPTPGTPTDCASSPDPSVFAFHATSAGVCVNPPGCSQTSFVTLTVSNVTGSLPASLGTNVSYTADGLVENTGTLPNPTIPGCSLVGSVVTLSGTVSANAFQTQTTAVGSDQTVTFPQTTFLNSLTDQVVSVDVSVTFSQVTSGGTTTVTATSNTAGALPANFATAINGYNATFLDVSTTAAVQSPIVVCSTYPDTDNDGFIDGTSPPVPESALSFLHGEGDPKVFVDRTFSRDPINNIICAQVDSLSPFVLAVNVGPTPTPTDTPTPTPTALCAATPASGCRSAGKSLLLLKNSTDDTKDKLTFKWLKGAATMLSDLGAPSSTTNYALCVYAGTAVATVNLPAGSDWQAAGTTGFTFTDPSGTPNGVQKALLKSGAAGKAKALVKGKGTNLPDTLVGVLPLPVTAQLKNDTNNVCFEGVYTMSNVIKNDGTQFKAKTP